MMSLLEIPDVDLVDFAVTDLDEEVAVYLFDVLVDVLGLDVHCRCQLACYRCSCSLMMVSVM